MEINPKTGRPCWKKERLLEAAAPCVTQLATLLHFLLYKYRYTTNILVSIFILVLLQLSIYSFISYRQRYIYNNICIVSQCCAPPSTIIKSLTQYIPTFLPRLIPLTKDNMFLFFFCLRLAPSLDCNSVAQSSLYRVLSLK